MKKITNFLKEIILGLSIITIIFGLILFLMGVIWFWLPDLQLDGFTTTIAQLGNWNAYLFIAGLILILSGVYYLYSYFKNKKFLLKELKTNKRSELLKRHNQLKNTVKQLPRKYKKMLKDKEEELNIK